MTDPIADLLTRIRNVNFLKRSKVEMPYSRLREQVLGALKREGMIAEVSAAGEGTERKLQVELKYGPNGESTFREIERVSRPGRRVYAGVEDLKPVLSGLGIQVLSTHKGILTDREARAQKVGGEILCRVY